MEVHVGVIGEHKQTIKKLSKGIIIITRQCSFCSHKCGNEWGIAIIYMLGIPVSLFYVFFSPFVLFVYWKQYLFVWDNLRMYNFISPPSLLTLVPCGGKESRKCTNMGANQWDCSQTAELANQLPTKAKQGGISSKHSVNLINAWLADSSSKLWPQNLKHKWHLTY